MGLSVWTPLSVLLLFLAGAPVGALAEEQKTWETTVSATGNDEAVLKGSIEPGEGQLETGAVTAKRSAGVIADVANVSGDASRTTFRLGLSAGVTAEVFTLANPYRIVVDLPDVAFSLAQGAGRDGSGLVKSFRYGLFAEGKARVVLDATGPVRIEGARMAPGTDGRRVDLLIDIVPMALESFGSGTGAKRSPAAQTRDLGPEEAAPRAKSSNKPMIVIDPGHGGVDPGAIGASNVLEKNVALGVALELRRALLAGGRYEIRMTRSSDVFVSLDRRLKISKAAGAALFISLHADSLEDLIAAQNIRGATVYTLSERASDERARRKADKENASDLIAGIEVSEADGTEQVKNILIDLLKRETANFSVEFSRTLVGRLGRAVPLSRDPQRSAAFKVLKQAHAPAVLVELGYLTNTEDERLMNTSEWRRKVAEQVRSAIDTFFARQSARAD